MTLVGILAHALLIPLPGAWIGFGLPLPETKFWERLLVSVALSPFLVALEFYALRFAGLSFAACAIAIPILNLPAAWLVLRAAKGSGRPPGNAVLGWVVIAICVCAYLFGPRLANPDLAKALAHAWMHSDTVYMLAGGTLAPEETLLAGARQAYPWFGHILPALLAYLSNVPPFEVYAWSNPIWALVTAGLCGAVARRMGGGVAAQVVAGFGFLFALNGLGHSLMATLPAGLTEAIPIFGDWRYTPVVWKYRFFNQVPFAMALFGSVVFALLGRSGRPQAVLLGLCAAGVGTIYPILLPSVVAMVAARMVAGWYAPTPVPIVTGIREWCVPVFAGSILAFAYIHFFVMVDRAVGVGALSSFSRMGAKAVEIPIANALYLVGLVAVFRRSWKDRRTAPEFLFLGALGCAAIYVPFEIPHWRMEYKFMFPIAFCLAPFAGIGLEPLLYRSRRVRIPIVCVLALVVSAPVLHKIITTLEERSVVRMDASSFVADLAPGEPFAELSRVVRERTPPDTVVLVDRTEVHLPTLMHRSLWVIPDAEKLFPGFNMRLSVFMDLIRGYNGALVRDRIAARIQLFHGEDDSAREDALSAVMELGRPALLVIEPDRHAAALSWLRSQGIGSPIHDAGGFVAWFVEAR